MSAVRIARSLGANEDLVEGICLIDSPAWTMHIVESTDVTVRNVKIISWRENGDGIDVNNSQRVRVEGS